jgi:hypothetical protein
MVALCMQCDDWNSSSNFDRATGLDSQAPSTTP